MEYPPKKFGASRLIRWSVIDHRHRPTENCRQIVASGLQGPAAALAICQDGDADGYILYGCDQGWNAVTDTWHPTLEDALQQAEFEYEGVSTTWTLV